MAAKIQGPYRRAPLLQILVFIVPFALYLTTLPNGFVYDDVPQIIDNPWIKSFDNLGAIFSSSHWKFQGTESNIYRPFFHLLLTIEYMVFGLKPWGYHLVNAMLHAFNTLILFKIAARLGSRRTLSGGGFTPGPGSSGEGEGRSLIARAASGPWAMPFIAAMIFALHPVNTEPVSWVSSIPELTYTLFFLLSFLFYMGPSCGAEEGGRGVRRILSYIFFAAALFCKEPALAFVPFVWLYELLLEDPGVVDGASLGKRLRRASSRAMPYLFIALVFLAVRGAVVGGLMHHAQIELTPLDVVLNIFPLFAAYIGKLILPIGLNAVYEFHPVVSVSEPRFLISFGATLAYVLILAASLKRGKGLAAFSLLWIALPLLPVLYVPALATVAFADRYLYLPSAGFAVFAALIFTGLLRASVKAYARAVGLLLLVITAILLLYAAGSLSRIQVWRGNMSLWTDTAVKSPMNPDVRYNFGWTYHELGMTEEAESEYEATLKLNPAIDEARFNLALIHLKRGEVREAYLQLLELRRRNPGYKEASRLIREIEANAGGF